MTETLHDQYTAQVAVISKRHLHLIHDKFYMIPYRLLFAIVAHIVYIDFEHVLFGSRRRPWRYDLGNMPNTAVPLINSRSRQSSTSMEIKMLSFQVSPVV
jgi:hypothetical protein